jgi:hypothetical protein
MIDDWSGGTWVILGHVAGAHAGYAGSIDISLFLIPAHGCVGEGMNSPTMISRFMKTVVATLAPIPAHEQSLGDEF